MTNPEAAAPTDMEAALREARQLIDAPPMIGEPLVNIARCLLASSAEVAALREQLARGEEDIRSLEYKLRKAEERAVPESAERTIRADERARAVDEAVAILVDIRGIFQREEAHSAVGAMVAAEYQVGLLATKAGALPKSGAADEREEPPPSEPNIEMLCRLVRESGLTMTLHGVPVESAEQLRGAAMNGALQRILDDGERLRLLICRAHGLLDSAKVPFGIVGQAMSIERLLERLGMLVPAARTEGTT